MGKYTTYLASRLQSSRWLPPLDKNCYNDHGAVDLPGEPRVSVKYCSSFCSSDVACDCFVYSSDGHCYKRKNCILNSCVDGGGTYVTFLPSQLQALQLESSEATHFWTLILVGGIVLVVVGLLMLF